MVDAKEDRWKQEDSYSYEKYVSWLTLSDSNRESKLQFQVADSKCPTEVWQISVSSSWRRSWSFQLLRDPRTVKGVETRNLFKPIPFLYAPKDMLPLLLQLEGQ